MNLWSQKSIFLAGVLLLAGLTLFLSLGDKADLSAPGTPLPPNQRASSADSPLLDTPPVTTPPSNLTEEIIKKSNADHNKDIVPSKASSGEEENPDAAGEDGDERPELTETEQLAIIGAATEAFRSKASEIEKKRALLEVLEVEHPQIVEVVLLALKDESPNIRKNALAGLMNVEEEVDINEPLIMALGDDDVEVTDEALDIMERIPSPNILRSIETALHAEESSSQIRAIGMLENVFVPEAVDLLVDKALTAGEVHEEAMNSLQFITAEVFTTPQEAQEWWKNNRDLFVFEE